MRKARLLLTVLVVTCSLLPAAAEAASRIEAVRGREYTITREHGPWMIMVAGFSNVRDEDRRAEGLSPKEAALELVYQLRKKGIPAYVFEQDGEIARIETQNRLRRTEQRVYAARRGMISVLAGNYDSPDDKLAKDTLEYIKFKFKSDFLLEQGGRFHPTPGRPTPTSGAFLTTNPLLTPEEVKEAKVDPLLIKLNTQNNYSLFENGGQYTLVIATFNGKASKYSFDDSEEASLLDKFKVTNSLDDAAMEALQLAESMRRATKFGYSRNYDDVFVWHDRHKSVVTIGSFDRPDDPELQRLMQQYAAKQKPHPGNPAASVLVAEVFCTPKMADFTKAEKHWLFDPVPRVMKVPRYRR